MLKYPWDVSWQTMTTHESFPTELTIKKLIFDVHGNQNNPWNMKQQDGAEELTDFNTIHDLQRFYCYLPD